MKLDTMAEPSASIYPALSAESRQAFRLQKIGEVEAFFRSEVERRHRLRKKYRRAVNTLDGLCASLGLACVGLGVGGTTLLATGIGLIPELVLEGATAVAGLIDVAGVAVSRRCSGKAVKHEAVRVLAASKLNTVHSHISKALEDCNISDDEYKLVLDEIEKYHAMKDDIQRKSASDGTSVIDEETKNELIKRGCDQAHASFIKKLATSESPSP